MRRAMRRKKLVAPSRETVAVWCSPGAAVWLALCVVLALLSGVVRPTGFPIRLILFVVLGVPLSLVYGFGALFMRETWPSRVCTGIALFNLTPIAAFWLLSRLL